MRLEKLPWKQFVLKKKYEAQFLNNQILKDEIENKN
jgi:hypothetical protein